MLETEFISASGRNSNRLMVVLHGLGDSSAGFHWLPEALGLPWMNYLLVNAPDQYYGGFFSFDFAGKTTPGIFPGRHPVFLLVEGATAQGFSHGKNNPRRFL